MTFNNSFGLWCFCEYERLYRGFKKHSRQKKKKTAKERKTASMEIEVLQSALLIERVRLSEITAYSAVISGMQSFLLPGLVQ